MVKTLQKKFIITAMTAVGILILVLIGALNLFHIISTDHRNDMLMDALTKIEMPPQEPGMQRPTPDFETPKGDGGGFLAGAPNENSKQNASFFLVFTDPLGKVNAVDCSRTPSLDETAAYDLATRALVDGKTEGQIGTWRFACKGNTIEGVEFVFLDVSESVSSVIRLALISVLVAIVSFGGMLFLVVLLSRKAIRPIARNMEQQKQFVTDAGHEIKTPLAIILANTEALALHEGENKWTRNIREQTVRLSDLMQNLLALAKIDESVESLQKEQTNLSELVCEVADMFAEGFSLKDIQYEQCVEGEIFCAVNRPLFTSLVCTLLDNAVKYTSRGGKVHLALNRVEKKIHLSVANTVEKVPSVPPEKLFDRFFHTDPSRRADGGFGIGLSAARTIVEAHGGKIIAKYEKDQTIAFWVTL